MTAWQGMLLVAVIVIGLECLLFCFISEDWRDTL
jgi:hypothetical protein